MTAAVETPAVPPQPGTAEYDAAMVKLAETRMGLEPEPVVAPTRPADVPEKFWNATTGAVDYTAMAKSYTELEKKLGAKPAPAAAAAPAAVTPAAKPATLDEQKAFLATKGVTPEAVAALDEAGIKAKYAELNPPAAAAPAAEAAAVQAGVDFPALQVEFNENGKLSEETYANLEKKGFTRDVVDTYIAGKQAAADAYDTAAFGAAGSQDALTTMTQWAAGALKDSEKKAFNDAVTSGDIDRMKLAVQGLRSAYERVNGSAPALLVGGNANASDVAGFKSRKEQSAAINDPRYKTDTAYRLSVEAKIGATTFTQ